MSDNRSSSWGLDDEFYEARLAESVRMAGQANSESSGRVADRVAELRAAHPEPLTIQGPKTIGDFILVEPGCEIWARTGLDGRMRTSADDLDGEGVAVRGGIVLEVIDDPEYNDDGEIVHHRAFRCFDYTARVKLDEAFVTLTEAQVDPTRFDGPRVDRLRGLCRRFCRYAADRTGVATRFELDLVIDAARLAAIVGQRLR